MDHVTPNEDMLAGGWGQNTLPERIGETVHREQNENSPFVHSLLTFLDEKSYSFAPRFLGVDEAGREIIEYIDGYVPHGQEVDPKTWSSETLTEIFQKIRSLHDITEDSDLAGNQECVCHGDLSYANTVYKDGRAVAFIDWDWAHPGKRIDDVAYALLQYLSIGEYFDDGPEGRAAQMKSLIGVYGLTSEQKSILVDTMRDCQALCVNSSDLLASRRAV